MLNYLGMDSLTHRVYLTLASQPVAGIEALARLLDLSEDDVRTGLNRLSAIALAELDSSGEPTRIVDPSVGLKALLAQERLELAERQSQVERAQLQIEQWLAANSAAHNADPHLTITALHGLDAVRDKLVELARECRDEVWSFNPGGGQSNEQLRSASPLNADTLARGVSMRAVYLDTALNHAGTAEYLKALSDLGAQVRTVPILPVRMLVVDREVALVPIDERDTSLGAVEVRNRGLVAGLVALFLTTWRVGRPFGTRPMRLPSGLREQERLAVVLWAQGSTDEAVARRLGVSPRTVRRMSETLSASVKARSRFELGARAMALGWVSEEDLL
ncbi:helix-turn-helix domain-containing protein [Intrasporangium sp.]|uniref:helix-turn-helix domain-containing protein n=1 Tax=Intrasporangium sp. TaxID=1925024 RepID=UPI003221F970